MPMAGETRWTGDFRVTWKGSNLLTWSVVSLVYSFSRPCPSGNADESLPILRTTRSVVFLASVTGVVVVVVLK